MTLPFPHNRVWANESAYWPNDPICGAEILQLTSNVSIATSIYCEDPAISPKNRLAVSRTQYASSYAPAELWVSDADTGMSVLVDTNTCWSGSCAQAYGDLYYYERTTDRGIELVRLRFSTLECEVVHRFEPGHHFNTLGSVSPDGKYVVSAFFRPGGVYDVVVLEVATGTFTTIASGPDFCNSHPRFDRMNGETLLVQHNRGQQRTEMGPLETVTELGTTLELGFRDGSPYESMPIAKPYIQPGVSGHESWLKVQRAFVYSTTPLDMPYDDGKRRGNLLLYRIGEATPSVLADAPNLYFGHVSTSACGKYWCCDVWPWVHDGSDACRVVPKIAVGSVATCQWGYVCDVGGQAWPRYENGHSHPYLSADNRHIIFTSTRAGLPQVFRATLPDGFLADLDSQG